MRKYILCLIVVFASPVVASDFVSATHFFPIASRTDGLAGTQWLTSVQIANPQADELTITARLSAEGAVESETIVIAPGETRGWNDFLGDLFSFEGNGALFLEADADSNGQLPAAMRSFAASMRISTHGDGGGSFGQGVLSMNPLSGFLGDWVAYFPGVQLWGQPGRDGFRTNVGFWNVGLDQAQMALRILDSTGAEMWSQTVTAQRHRPHVIPLPRDLDLETATLVVEPIGGWLDCAVYISVVDNITGDAVFLTSQLMDPDGAVGATGRTAGELERLGALVRGAGQ